MEPIKNILVGLDLSKHDQHVISYAGFLSSILKPDELHFVHVQKELHLPKEVVNRFPILLEAIDRTLVQEMVTQTAEHQLPHTAIMYDVASGHPFEELHKLSHKKENQLLIVGQKDDQITTEKNLARKISSPIVFVPEINKPKLERILVPIDFSKDAEHALMAAIEIAKQTGAEVFCQNVYEVPKGYHKIGKTYTEFAEIMKGHVETDFKHLYEKLDFKGVRVHPCIISLKNDQKIAAIIQDTASDLKADLVVLGAKGRTGIASVLLGSVAEQLLSKPLGCPLFLCKKDKNHLMDFWDTITYN